jgi:hypothetical protein
LQNGLRRKEEEEERSEVDRPVVVARAKFN